MVYSISFCRQRQVEEVGEVRIWRAKTAPSMRAELKVQLRQKLMPLKSATPRSE
jgi:hypothetical protein